MYKDGNGLQFIKFDFVTGGQEIKATVLMKLGAIKPMFFFNFPLLLSLLLIFSFYFRIIQQA